VRRGLTLDDVPPKGYKVAAYWASNLSHEFYASGDEVWEITAADVPGGMWADKHRSALVNALRRHGSGRVVSRSDRVFLICENGNGE